MFLYNNNEQYKKKIKQKTASNGIKCLGINLTEEATDLYLDNYKTLLKEIKKDANKWKDVPCS